MKIFAKNSKDEIVPIEDISENTQVKEIKKRLIDKYNINTEVEEIVLIHNGEELGEDEETLEYYDITDGITILFVRRYNAGYNK